MRVGVDKKTLFLSAYETSLSNSKVIVLVKGQYYSLKLL